MSSLNTGNTSLPINVTAPELTINYGNSSYYLKIAGLKLSKTKLESNSGNWGLDARRVVSTNSKLSPDLNKTERVPSITSYKPLGRTIVTPGDDVVSWIKNLKEKAEETLRENRREEKLFYSELNLLKLNEQTERENSEAVDESAFNKLGQLLDNLKRETPTVVPVVDDFVEEEEREPLIDQTQDLSNDEYPEKVPEDEYESYDEKSSVQEYSDENLLAEEYSDEQNMEQEYSEELAEESEEFGTKIPNPPYSSLDQQNPVVQESLNEGLVSQEDSDLEIIELGSESDVLPSEPEDQNVSNEELEQSFEESDEEPLDTGEAHYKYQLSEQESEDLEAESDHEDVEEEDEETDRFAYRPYMSPYSLRGDHPETSKPRTFDQVASDEDSAESEDSQQETAAQYNEDDLESYSIDNYDEDNDVEMKASIQGQPSYRVSERLDSLDDQEDIEVENENEFNSEDALDNEESFNDEIDEDNDLGDEPMAFEIDPELIATAVLLSLEAEKRASSQVPDEQTNLFNDESVAKEDIQHEALVTQPVLSEEPELTAAQIDNSQEISDNQDSFHLEEMRSLPSLSSSSELESTKEEQSASILDPSLLNLLQGSLFKHEEEAKLKTPSSVLGSQSISPIPETKEEEEEPVEVPLFEANELKSGYAADVETDFVEQDTFVVEGEGLEPQSIEVFEQYHHDSDPDAHVEYQAPPNDIVTEGSIADESSAESEGEEEEIEEEFVTEVLNRMTNEESDVVVEHSTQQFTTVKESVTVEETFEIPKESAFEYPSENDEAVQAAAELIAFMRSENMESVPSTSHNIVDNLVDTDFVEAIGEENKLDSNHNSENEFLKEQDREEESHDLNQEEDISPVRDPTFANSSVFKVSNSISVVDVSEDKAEMTIESVDDIIVEEPEELVTPSAAPTHMSSSLAEERFNVIEISDNLQSFSTLRTVLGVSDSTPSIQTTVRSDYFDLQQPDSNFTPSQLSESEEIRGSVTGSHDEGIEEHAMHVEKADKAEEAEVVEENLEAPVVNVQAEVIPETDLRSVFGVNFDDQAENLESESFAKEPEGDFNSVNNQESNTTVDEPSKTVVDEALEGVVDEALEDVVDEALKKLVDESQEISLLIEEPGTDEKYELGDEKSGEEFEEFEKEHIASHHPTVQAVDDADDFAINDEVNEQDKVTDENIEEIPSHHHPTIQVVNDEDIFAIKEVNGDKESMGEPVDDPLDNIAEQVSQVDQNQDGLLPKDEELVVVNTEERSEEAPVTEPQSEEIVEGSVSLESSSETSNKRKRDEDEQDQESEGKPSTKRFKWISSYLGKLFRSSSPEIADVVKSLDETPSMKEDTLVEEEEDQESEAHQTDVPIEEITVISNVDPEGTVSSQSPSDDEYVHGDDILPELELEKDDLIIEEPQVDETNLSEDVSSAVPPNDEAESESKDLEEDQHDSAPETHEEHVTLSKSEPVSPIVQDKNTEELKVKPLQETVSTTRYESLTSDPVNVEPEIPASVPKSEAEEAPKPKERARAKPKPQRKAPISAFAAIHNRVTRSQALAQYGPEETSSGHATNELATEDFEFDANLPLRKGKLKQNSKKALAATKQDAKAEQKVAPLPKRRITRSNDKVEETNTEVVNEIVNETKSEEETTKPTNTKNKGSAISNTKKQTPLPRKARVASATALSNPHITMRTRSGKYIGANTSVEIASAAEQELLEDKLISEVASGDIKANTSVSDVAQDYDDEEMKRKLKLMADNTILEESEDDREVVQELTLNKKRKNTKGKGRPAKRRR